jgi:hypothetical protein
MHFSIVFIFNLNFGVFSPQKEKTDQMAPFGNAGSASGCFKNATQTLKARDDFGPI